MGGDRQYKGTHLKHKEPTASAEESDKGKKKKVV